MAREFENLEILISVLNERALQNINELIRRIEALNAASKKVRRIRIKVNVVDRELDQLLAKMGAAQAGGAAGVDVSAGRDEARAMAEMDKVAVSQRGRLIQLATSRNSRLKSIDRSLSILIAQGAKQIQASHGGGGPAGFGPGQLEEIGHAFADASFAHLRGIQDPMARGRPGEITTRQSIFNIKMRDINNALAKLLPLMITFRGAMLSATVGVIGLATAAATAAGALVGIAGLGLLGVAGARADGTPDFEAFQEIMEDIRNMFLDAFMPLATRLAPFMERAMDGLGMLFEDLAIAMTDLLDMRGDAQDFGRWIRNVLPELVSDLLDFSQAFMPIFRAIGEFIKQTDLVGALADATEAVLPNLAELVHELIRAGPILLGLSQGFLNVVTVIVQLLGILSRLAHLFGIGGERLGAFIATGLAAVSVLAILNALITFRLIPAMAGAAHTIIGKTAATLRLFGVDKVHTLAIWAKRAATWKLVAVTLTFVSVATLGLGVILGLAGGLLDSASAADQATKALSDFNSELDGTRDRASPYQGPEDAPQAVGDQAFRRANGNGSGSVEAHFHGDQDPDDFDTKMNNALFKMR